MSAFRFVEAEKASYPIAMLCRLVGPKHAKRSGASQIHIDQADIEPDCRSPTMPPWTICSTASS